MFDGKLFVAGLASITLLSACQAPTPPGSASLAVDRLPATLTDPAVMDWSTQQISGQVIAERRAANAKRRIEAEAATATARQRRVQAFTAGTGWTTSTTGGVAVNTVSASVPAGDYVPNGPAAVYGTDGTPAACFNQLFFLTQGGKLIRVAKDRSSQSTLNLGKTFTRTYVTLSPAGGRAYLLADDGTFFMVETGTTPMTVTVVSTGAAGNNQGLAPALDSQVSNPADWSDEVYVPYSNGVVQRFSVKKNPTTMAGTATPLGTYTVCGPMKATPIVLNGVIYAGDQSGNFVRFDANANAVLSTTALNYPINATAAIDFDASANPSDAFVNAGTRCHWINFATGTVVSSQPLFLDETAQAGNRKSGTLSQWTYGPAAAKYWLPPADAVNVCLDTQPLAGADASGYKAANYLCPSDTNTRVGGARTDGGPVYSYLRWDIQNSPLPGSAKISGLKLWMKTANTVARQIRAYDIWDTSAYLTTGGLWTTANMPKTSPARPAIGTTSIATWTGNLLPTPIQTTPQGRVIFNPNVWHPWTFRASATPTSLPLQYAVGIKNLNTAGNNGSSADDNPMWPEVVNAEDNGNAAQKATRYGPQWYLDPTATSTGYVTTTSVADPSGLGDNRPLLEVLTNAKAMGSGSINTPPIIDGYGGRRNVIVFNGNAVFSLDYTSASTFADTAGTNTVFNVTRTGSKGVNNYSPCFPAAGASANLYVVDNKTAPVINYDGASLFVLDRYPVDNNVTPNGYIYSLNKLALPLITSGAAPYTNYQEFGVYTGSPLHGVTREASSHMVIDYFGYSLSGGSVHFGLPGVYNATPASGTLVRVN